MDKKQFDQLLAEFGRVIGIHGLCLDEDDACMIGFDDKIMLNIQLAPDTGSLVIFTGLGPVKKQAQAKVLADLLEAGFYQRAQGGPSFGFNRENNMAMMIYQTDTRFLDTAGFESVVENFVNTAEAWMTYIERSGDTDHRDKLVPPAPPMPPGMMA